MRAFLAGIDDWVWSGGCVNAMGRVRLGEGEER